MPIGAILGTSQMYLSSFLFVHSGPVLFPNEAITLNSMCLWVWFSALKCLETGVDNDFFRIFNTRYVFIHPMTNPPACFVYVLFITFSTMY